MGLIRGGLLAFVSVLFFIGLLMANLLGTLYSSLDYNDVKPHVSGLVQGVLLEQVPENISQSDLNKLKSYCVNASYFVLENNFSDFPVNLSCDSIDKGQTFVVGEIVNETFDKVYYAEYGCAPLECLDNQDKPFYFVSQEFQDYTGYRFYIVSLVLIALFILIFILAEQKSNAFLLGGILLIISGLPFMSLESFVPEGDNILSIIVQIFFSASRSVFINVLVLGIVFIAIGIALKFFKIGFKISSLFEKFKKKPSEDKESVSKEDVKKIVKEEVSKSKGQTKKRKN